MPLAVEIRESVGKFGKNKPVDVLPVQILLNKFIVPGCLKPLAILQQDGQSGSKTIGAIKMFQRRVVGLSKPDGRVDPGGKTIKALNGPLVWTDPAADMDEEKTKKWAIALHSIRSGVVIFSLANRVTALAQKIMVFNPAITAVEVNKTFKETWVSFETFFDAGFRDFDGTRVSMSDVGAASSGINMKFGWVASLPVHLIGPDKMKHTCPLGVPSVSSGTIMGSSRSIMGCQMGGRQLDLGNAKLGSAITLRDVASGNVMGSKWAPPARLPALFLAQ